MGVRQRDIFGTLEDLRPGLEAIEARWQLKYIPYDWHPTPELTTYLSVFDIPRIGKIPEPVPGFGSAGFVVFPRDVVPNAPPSLDPRGGVKLYHWPPFNDTAFYFEPGGVTRRGFLREGRIVLADDCEGVLPLYTDFVKTVTRGFKRIERWYFGPEALGLLDAGRCIHINEPESRPLRRHPKGGLTI
jgi:hypothetical protein